MRGFIRRHRIPLAIGLAALAPYPSTREFAPVGIVLIILLLAGGFIGSGHAGVGVGGAGLMGALLLSWLIYAGLIYLILTAWVGKDVSTKGAVASIRENHD